MLKLGTRFSENMYFQLSFSHVDILTLFDTFKVMNIKICFLFFFFILQISITHVYIHEDKEFNSFCGMLYVRMRRIYRVCFLKVFLSTSNLIIDLMTSFCISLGLYLKHNLIFYLLYFLE